MSQAIKNAIENVSNTIEQITSINEHKHPKSDAPDAANNNHPAASNSDIPAFVMNPQEAAKQPHAVKIMRDRFLRNFDKVEFCDAVNSDISGSGKTPTSHFHIRFWLPEDVSESLDTYKKIAYLNQEADRGKAVLSQYGITAHDEAVVEKVHRDTETGKVTNGWIQFDTDFPEKIANRGDTMRTIEADLQQGIEEAKASRNQSLAMA